MVRTPKHIFEVQKGEEGFTNESDARLAQQILEAVAQGDFQRTQYGAIILTKRCFVETRRQRGDFYTLKDGEYTVILGPDLFVFEIPDNIAGRDDLEEKMKAAIRRMDEMAWEAARDPEGCFGGAGNNFLPPGY